jgi:hypothetical protein
LVFAPCSKVGTVFLFVLYSSDTVGSADAFTAGYTQSELMVANKGFMSEQEKDNQVAVSSLFTAAMIGLPPVPK